jgi:hypothetical protein
MWKLRNVTLSGDLEDDLQLFEHYRQQGWELAGTVRAPDGRREAFFIRWGDEPADGADDQAADP